jgi:starvation-inducible DNA-binding protein
MFKTPSHLPEAARTQVVASLNARVADGLDLYSQLKTAHWNIKGPHFAALHPLFEQIATSVLEANDELAERAITLGGWVRGTVRAAAKTTRLEEYPQDVTRDLEHVRLLAGRLVTYLAGLRESRGVGEEVRDTDTVDLLTGIITAVEKHAWFLQASLGE